MKNNKSEFSIKAELGMAIIIELIASASIATPTISNVIAQQRYPWNGKVDISYEVAGDLSAGLPEDYAKLLVLSASNRVDGVSYVASDEAFSGDIGTEEGVHHVVWDLNAQGFEFKSSEVVFSVAYVATPNRYCVIDLSAGAGTESYPVTYLLDMPSSGWTDEYKTNKLVLRRIAPGQIPTRDAAITKPFYIGIFEVTQKQYELVMGLNPSSRKGDALPVEWVSWNTIRGNSGGPTWPASSDVGSTTFMGKLRAKTNIGEFDLPTSAQWEYACRAGTTSDYNNGGDSIDDLKLLGRCSANTADGKGGYSGQHTKVGSYLPNAWGLYDMHGNVFEWCLDWYGGSLLGDDPVGPSSGSYRTLRGGSWCTLAAREYISSFCGVRYAYQKTDDIGFRLVRTLPNIEATQRQETVSILDRTNIICEGEGQMVAIDSRIGVRESLGNETITYSSHWNGYDGAMVTIEQNGAVLAENLAGSGEIPWRVNYDGVFALTHTTYTNGIAGERLLATFLVDRVNLDPLIIEPSGGEFANVSQTISLSCATDGAKIYYTTDGSDPRTNGREYTKPFTVYKSCIVRAVSSIGGWMEYPEAMATFTRSESLSEAANLYGYTMETDEVVSWVVDGEVSRDGVSSVRSGAIGNNGTTWLQTSIKKAGTVSFWWKAACEDADEEEGEDGYYDYGAFLVDDVVEARIAGHDGEWHYVSHEVNSGGKHTLKWEYRKDGVTSYAPDCIWVDQVQWIPADGSGYTLTTPEPVPYSWLTEYGLGAGTDFETAASVLSGKMQSGKATRIWEEFVAGTDPTNEASVLTATIEVRDGAPVVTWEPDLNESGTKSARLYKVSGKENLTDSTWAYPTNSLHRFFKVTVEMP